MPDFLTRWEWNKAAHSICLLQTSRYRSSTFCVAPWEWNALGVCTGQAVLGRLSVRKVQYDGHPEGSQFGLSWADFSTWKTLASGFSGKARGRKCFQGSLYFFFHVVFSKFLFDSLCVKWTLFPAPGCFPIQESRFHSAVGRDPWHGSQHATPGQHSSQQDPMVMRMERTPNRHFKEGEPSSLSLLGDRV